MSGQPGVVRIDAAQLPTGQRGSQKLLGAPGSLFAALRGCAPAATAREVAADAGAAWWMAQGTAYLARFSARARGELARFRAAHLAGPAGPHAVSVCAGAATGRGLAVAAGGAARRALARGRSRAARGRREWNLG